MTHDIILKFKSYKEKQAFLGWFLDGGGEQDANVKTYFSELHLNPSVVMVEYYEEIEEDD